MKFKVNAFTVIGAVFVLIAIVFGTGLVGTSSIIGVGQSFSPPNSASFVLTAFDATSFTGVSEVNFDDGQFNQFTHYVAVDGKVAGQFKNNPCSTKLYSAQGSFIGDSYCTPSLIPNDAEGRYGVPAQDGSYTIVPARSSYEQVVQLPALSTGTHVIGVYRLSDFGKSNGTVYANHDVVRGSVCENSGFAACSAAPFCRDDAVDTVTPSYVGEVVSATILSPYQPNVVVCHDVGPNMKGCPSFCNNSGFTGNLPNPPVLSQFVKMAEFSTTVGTSPIETLPAPAPIVDQNNAMLAGYSPPALLATGYSVAIPAPLKQVGFNGLTILLVFGSIGGLLLFLGSR